MWNRILKTLKLRAKPAQRNCICNFCGRSNKEVQILLEQDENTYICNKCVEKHTKTEESEYEVAAQQLRHASERLAEIESKYTSPIPPLCNFCGNGKRHYWSVVEGIDRNICNVCLNRAKHFLDSR